MQQLLENNELALMEAAVVERCRRSENVELHPELVVAPLIYQQQGRAVLRRIFQDYIDVARAANLPLLVCTPTWRADSARVRNSGVSDSVNVDATRFMQQIAHASENRTVNIKIGGLLGCKNDCYRAEEGLSTADAERFHQWQVGQLAQSGVDFLIAETLPNVDEAVGIARVMARSGTPYFISFVIARSGKLLDGTSLLDAIERIDGQPAAPPLGYMINCAYPTFLQPAKQPKELFHRLVGFLANASALDHSQLDQAATLQGESVADWGDRMLELNRNYGVTVLGGCCGTSREHLQYLVHHRP
jgi:S-methylmethionine-dependent homocysteine/selenocysteine methylase